MSGPQNPLPQLVSSKQAARVLGIPEGTLRYWRCIGTGPAWVKLGRRTLYSVADLVEFVARAVETPPCASWRLTMSLYKIGNVWHYSFYWGDRRYRGSTKQMQRTKAERVQAEAMAKVREQPHVRLTGRTPLLREIAPRFLAWVGTADLAAKTKAYYRNGWRLLSQTKLATIRLSDISEEQIAALHLCGSAANANNARRTLRRMLGKAHAWGRAGVAPKIRLLKEKRRTLLIDSGREQQLLSFACQPLRDVLVIMQDSGLRPDEVLNMRWEHIDWLQKTASNPFGKTERARRVVPISERVLAILRQRGSSQNQGWVFPSPQKRSRTGHFSLSTVEHQFVDARSRAGLPETLVLYCARHTYATDALARTGNVAAVMDTMGHANVQTTMIYQHQGLEQIRNAINLRNKENRMRQIGTEEIFGQNLGQSLKGGALASRQVTETMVSAVGIEPTTY